LLEPVGVHLAQHLDVHEAIADLDVVAGAGEQVELFALLQVAGHEGGEARFGAAEAATERAPLPARNDVSHGGHDRRFSRERNRSLVVSFDVAR